MAEAVEARRDDTAVEVLEADPALELLEGLLRVRVRVRVWVRVRLRLRVRVRVRVSRCEGPVRGKQVRWQVRITLHSSAVLACSLTY